jgi:DNA-binding GntR family transcriptional regulator
MADMLTEDSDLLKVESRRLFDEVYQRLREAIVTGLFSPGERFVERSLTTRLSVSRTPLREAMKRLEEEGLIVCYPHRGCFVRTPSYDEARQAYEMRRAVEGMAGELAAQRATGADLDRIEDVLIRGRAALAANDREAMLLLNNEFHQLQAEAARNIFLERQLRRLSAYVDLLRGRRWVSSDRPPATQQEHEAIFAAVKAGDGPLARQLNEEHVDRAWAKVAASFQADGADLDIPIDDTNAGGNA